MAVVALMLDLVVVLVALLIKSSLILETKNHDLFDFSSWRFESSDLSQLYVLLGQIRGIFRRSTRQRIYSTRRWKNEACRLISDGTTTPAACLLVQRHM